MVQNTMDGRSGLIYNIGEMAEWSNAAVSKTVVPLPRDRGFEPPSLRKAFIKGSPKVTPRKIHRGFAFPRQEIMSEHSERIIPV
jgi:hypothetical protein